MKETPAAYIPHMHFGLHNYLRSGPPYRNSPPTPTAELGTLAACTYVRGEARRLLSCNRGTIIAGCHFIVTMTSRRVLLLPEPRLSVAKGNPRVHAQCVPAGVTCFSAATSLVSVLHCCKYILCFESFVTSTGFVPPDFVCHVYLLVLPRVGCLYSSSMLSQTVGKRSPTRLAESHCADACMELVEGYFYLRAKRSRNASEREA